MSEVLTHPWKDRISIFGKIYAPYVALELEDINHEWHEFIMKIDSGAVVTAMNADDYSFLGYTIDPDNKTLLYDAQGNSLTVYIHKVNMKFGQYIIPEVPIAFAQNKISELLLGRQEVFDFFVINLMGRSRSTDFSLSV